MEEDTALPPWIIFLLIALGIAFAVGVALLLTQLDGLQQRTLLPQATLPVIDLDATVAAGDLTVVVISGDDSPASTPTLAPPPTLQPSGQATAASTAGPIIVPTCTAIPSGWTPYTVQDGDTTASLSEQFGISADALSHGNCLAQSQELKPGQIIYVPLLTPTVSTEAACGAPRGWVHYTVQPGETLASIADKRHTTVEMLMQANCLEDELVIPGRKIFVPPMPMKPQAATPPQSPQKPPPGWHPGNRPTATSPVWPTKIVTSTATRVTPTLAPTHTVEPTPTSTATVPATASPTATAPATMTPAPVTVTPALVTATPTVTPESPQPTETGGPPYPGAAASPTATLTPPAYPYP